MQCHKGEFSQKQNYQCYNIRPLLKEKWESYYYSTHKYHMIHDDILPQICSLLGYGFALCWLQRSYFLTSTLSLQCKFIFGSTLGYQNARISKERGGSSGATEEAPIPPSFVQNMSKDTSMVLFYFINQIQEASPINQLPHMASL